jgi:hypothetical protein
MQLLVSAIVDIQNLAAGHWTGIKSAEFWILWSGVAQLVGELKQW